MNTPLIIHKKFMVALLIAGSASMLLSCKEKELPEINPETLITMRSEKMTTIVSKNGNKSYLFSADLMESYGQAKEPFTLYPKGISIETYRDSTGVVESTLRSNEAVYYDKRKLWMTSGDVVATGSGRTIYTQQLFYDEKTDRIYSNVLSRIVDADGDTYVQGFESDREFKVWELRDYEGAVGLETSPVEETNGDNPTQPVRENSSQPDVKPGGVVSNSSRRVSRPPNYNRFSVTSNWGESENKKQGD